MCVNDEIKLKIDFQVNRIVIAKSNIVVLKRQKKRLIEWIMKLLW